MLYLKTESGGLTSDYWGYIFKKDNIVWFTIHAPNGVRTLAKNQFNLIAILDEKYRPNREVAIAASSYQDANAALSAYVNKQGEVRVYNPSTSAISYWRAFGIYFTN